MNYFVLTFLFLLAAAGCSTSRIYEYDVLEAITCRPSHGPNSLVLKDKWDDSIVVPITDARLTTLDETKEYTFLIVIRHVIRYGSEETTPLFVKVVREANKTIFENHKKMKLPDIKLQAD